MGVFRHSINSDRKMAARSAQDGLAHHTGNLPEPMLPGGLANSLKSETERERKSLPLRSPWEKCMSSKRLFPLQADSQMLCRAVLMSQGCLASEKPRLVSWTWATNMSVWPGLLGFPLEESMLYLHFQLIKKLFISNIPSIPVLKLCFHCFCSSLCV